MFVLFTYRDLYIIELIEQNILHNCSNYLLKQCFIGFLVQNYNAFKGIQNKIAIANAAKAIWGMLYAIL